MLQVLSGNPGYDVQLRELKFVTDEYKEDNIQFGICFVRIEEEMNCFQMDMGFTKKVKPSKVEAIIVAKAMILGLKCMCYHANI